MADGRLLVDVSVYCACGPPAEYRPTAHFGMFSLNPFEPGRPRGHRKRLQRYLGRAGGLCQGVAGYSKSLDVL